MSFNQLLPLGKTLLIVLLAVSSTASSQAQSVWSGNSGTGPDRWNRPGNWNNFLPPILPIQDAVFGDIAGPTNVAVRSFFGFPTTVAPRNMLFTNVADTYTISIPSGSDLRPQSITVDGSGDIIFAGDGEIQGQVLTLGALTIDGSGSSLLTIDSEIGNGVLNLPTRLIHEREAGVTELNGANTYTGGTDLVSGTIVLGDDDALGSGLLTINGGVLSNDGGGRNVTVDVLQEGDFTIRDESGGAGLFFTQDFELGAGDLVVTLSTDSGLACFEGLLSGVADTLTFRLEAGTSSFNVQICGIDSNTFAGLVVVENGVVLGLDKDPMEIAIAGDLRVDAGGTVVTFESNQFAASSNLEIQGDLLLGLLPFDVDEQVASIVGAGNIAASLASVSLTVDSGDFTGIISDGTDGGDLAIIKESPETLVLGGANSYTGGTTINGGLVRTESTTALGTGPIALNGGATLQPIAGLDVGSLDWNGGEMLFDLDGGSLLNVDTTFDNGGGGGTFVFDNGTLGATYRLVNFGTTTFLETDFAALWVNPMIMINGTFELDTTSNFLDFTFLSAVATGAILQNSDPVNIPTFANFIVNGVVTTGTPSENNIINSLIFNPSSSLEVFNNLTVTSGNFTVGSGTATIFGGTILTPGDFNKNGAGTLLANSNFGIGGAANINAGALFVNGIFSVAQGLTVFQSALLGGNGIINGNVFNNGVVAPGNSVGTLTINGNYTQSSSGTFQLEIASLNSFDRLLVSGNASLAGTLQVLNLGKNLKYGQQYAFLQAGSISGEFDAIQMPNPSRYRGRFLTNGGTGTLLVAPTSYTLVAETPNQRRVAKALNSYIPARGNDREVVSIALDVQAEEQYPAAFDQIAPTFHESIANISIEQAFAQTQLLNQRMSSVRLGAAGFQAISIDTEPLVHDKDGKSVADAKDLKSEITGIKSPAWSLWAQGNGIFAKVTNVSHVPNYRFDGGGFLFGADYTFGSGNPRSTIKNQQSAINNSSLTTGLFGGYQGTYADYGSAGRTSINSALFGLYASYTKGGFYADAVVAGGYNNYNVRRSIDFSTIDRTARSSQDGGQFSAALNFGYDWEIGKFTLGPIAGVQYTYVGIAPFTESGADSLNLRVGQQNANSMRTTFGGRVAYTWNLTESITIIPEVRMFWLHEFLNNPRVIGAALDGGNGPGFDYLTSTPARDSVFAGAGLTAQFGESWYASAYWNIDFGRQDYLGNIVSLNLGWKF